MVSLELNYVKTVWQTAHERQFLQQRIK